MKKLWFGDNFMMLMKQNLLQFTKIAKLDLIIWKFWFVKNRENLK